VSGFEGQIRSIVIDLLVLLAEEDYESIMERCASSGMTGKDLQTAVGDYGRKVIAPPADYAHWNMGEIEAATVPTWWVVADLWTKEEGRSDLSLELTIAFTQNGPVVEIDNLHVL
jgi:hypothetical protein